MRGYIILVRVCATAIVGSWKCAFDIISVRCMLILLVMYEYHTGEGKAKEEDSTEICISCMRQGEAGL